MALSAVSLLCASPRAGSPTGLEPGSEGTGLVPVSFSGVNFLGLRSELEEMLQKVESWNVGGNKRLFFFCPAFPRVFIGNWIKVGVLG